MGATIMVRGLLMLSPLLKLMPMLSLDMATLPMAMDTLLMDMLTMATITARGLLMPSMDIITMARGLLSLDMAMDMLMVMDMAMVMDTIAMVMASRFILNIPLKSSDVIPKKC